MGGVRHMVEQRTSAGFGKGLAADIAYSNIHKGTVQPDAMQAADALATQAIRRFAASVCG